MHENVQGITVVASFRLKKGHLNEVLPVITACIRASRQEATNFSYTCRRDLKYPLQFVFIEQWKSVAAIDEHEKQPHFLAMKAVLEKSTEGPLNVTLLENVSVFS